MDARRPSSQPPPLVEGRDYVVDAEGRYVFTAAYLLARGSCCGSGCRNCPYEKNGGAPAKGTHPEPQNQVS